MYPWRSMTASALTLGRSNIPTCKRMSKRVGARRPAVWLGRAFTLPSRYLASVHMYRTSTPVPQNWGGGLLASCMPWRIDHNHASPRRRSIVGTGAIADGHRSVLFCRKWPTTISPTVYYGPQPSPGLIPYSSLSLSHSSCNPMIRKPPR